MATNHSQKHDDPVDPSLGYEKRDAHASTLLQFGFWLAVLIAVTLFAMKWTFDYFARTEPLGAPAAPFVKNERPLPPSPRLQVQPHVELEDYCQAQEKEEDTYGWVDKQSGIVRIPIDRAMEIVLARGLPARASMPAPSGAPSDSGGPSAGPADPRAPGVPDVDGPCGYLAPPTGAESQRQEEK
jgi:hypothetical protein